MQDGNTQDGAALRRRNRWAVFQTVISLAIVLRRLKFLLLKAIAATHMPDSWWNCPLQQLSAIGGSAWFCPKLPLTRPIRPSHTFDPIAESALDSEHVAGE